MTLGITCKALARANKALAELNAEHATECDECAAGVEAPETKWCEGGYRDPAGIRHRCVLPEHKTGRHSDGELQWGTP